jgi:glucokinase
VSYRVGIDLGGTHIKAAALAEDGAVLHRDTVPTRDGERVGGVPAWADSIERLLAEWNDRFQGPAAHVGLAAPGLPAPDRRSILSMPERMDGLEGFEWDVFLGRPRVPVFNDAHAALLGEAWQGAARGRRHAVLFTLGTGVGGAILADGRLLGGAIGRAGHLGHLSLDTEGPVGILRTPGALEELVGECSLPARTGGRFRTTRDLLAAADGGDADAAAVWARSVRALTCAIASAINVLDPEVVILGGGVTEAGDRLWVPLARELDEIEWRPRGYRVPIVRAELGSWAGAYGAASPDAEAQVTAPSRSSSPR